MKNSIYAGSRANLSLAFFKPFSCGSGAHALREEGFFQLCLPYKIKSDCCIARQSDFISQPALQTDVHIFFIKLSYEHQPFRYTFFAFDLVQGLPYKNKHPPKRVLVMLVRYTDQRLLN